MEEMTMKVITIIIGILLTVGGFFCIFRPGMTFLSTGWMLGLMLVIAGMNMTAAYIPGKGRDKKKDTDKGNLLCGIIISVLGLFLIVSGISHAVADIIILYVFGAGMAISGLLKISGGLFQKKRGIREWGWSLAFGILTICLGVYCFFHPLASAYAIGYILGFIVLMQGFNLISLGSNLE